MSTLDYLDPGVVAAATRSLLHPVLLQLLPHVQGIISGSSNNSSSSSSRTGSAAAADSADDAWRIITIERGLSQLLLVLSEGGKSTPRLQQCSVTAGPATLLVLCRWLG
jgi:hypothetical protein